MVPFTSLPPGLPILSWMILFDQDPARPILWGKWMISWFSRDIVSILLGETRGEGQSKVPLSAVNIYLPLFMLNSSGYRVGDDKCTWSDLSSGCLAISTPVHSNCWFSGTSAQILQLFPLTAAFLHYPNCSPWFMRQYMLLAACVWARSPEL